MHDQSDGEQRDVEGGGLSSGLPAAGTLDGGGTEPIGTSGKRHWRESTITDPGLGDRGNVFFAAIEMTRMPMILTDPNQADNPIVFANKAFLDLTLYEEGEVLGRNCRFLQGANTDRDTVGELRQAVAARESIALEILNYRRDGSAFWNAVFIGPVYDVSGTLLYFFASQLDVTRRRDVEQGFRQAQKMEAIGQLTAGLAHDFNNLLQVVNGNLELLEARVQGERERRYVGNARAAADRGAKLTGQLLAFARKTRLDPKPIDVSEQIEAFADVMGSATGQHVDLRLELARELPRAALDPEQFEMTILNILVNARDAMPNGGTVTITTGRRQVEEEARAHGLSPGDYVTVEVRDTGVGMSPSVVQRATEPFFTTKSTGKGTGLGLAMASGFVQQSRGRMEIESEQGQGTTIRLLLPVTSDEATVTRAAQPAGKVEEGVPSAHILLVEDSAEVLDLAREILGGVGYRITAAVNGDAGLAAFKQAQGGDPIDLLFTDLVMPGSMNGIMLAEEVGRLDPEVGILLTTGYNEELVSEGPARPGLDVLGKPYRRTELLDRVRQALNQRHIHGERRRRSDFGVAEA